MSEDADLIARLQDPARKDAAFRVLLEKYQQRLYWHIRRMVISHDDTDDVLQNTFIKVFRHIDNFKGQSKLYSWMYRIATNEALSYMKKRSQRMGITDEALREHLVDSLEADPYFDGDQAQLQLQRALAGLPDKQRQVFNLKYFEEMKYEEMSELLETSVGALKASYHLAVKKVESYLREINA
ncbi:MULTISPECIES: RNA polymerase sigma factor [Robiginitalea]|uniref:RNA polymerase sigma-70 factor, ECF subfamily protein n=1 Tax=Robiginitalea biformata (strain ATCC BAA-864 / DSM 15991 / KCTC 12146 / HTCC2501) TaxID=313596 RepID=A4CNL5_ROBBH|nr:MULTISPECIES: RNA polymerase sigma factor [Robiginitalea]EAR14482.1 RNA polymerase sigma-70 factor, ECF subfamily protein [Robiginitalea biformata HTCC2501]MDC6355032.1 RNA polymerase sigma factor [Robiginitalea sp. PM2]MDC6375299.1 RNA polymerase sigma factor [Robiginitalea sp. SP8]